MELREQIGNVERQLRFLPGRQHDALPPRHGRETVCKAEQQASISHVAEGPRIKLVDLVRSWMLQDASILQTGELR